MKTIFISIMTLFIGVISVFQLKPTENQGAAINTIAFGSCNNQDAPQPLWTAILKTKPDIWIWLGDNIYADTENMAEMRKKYDKQSALPAYKQLKAACPIIGTWDDHDFGANDSDRMYPKAEESKQAMLDFLGVAKDAPQRTRAGAYTSYTAGHGPRQVKIILLDTRTFKDPLQKKDEAFVPNPTANLLGEAQWTWFENELKTSKASINIVANGTPVIASEHAGEKWANFPKERARLFKTIAQSSAKGILLLSGDRHWAEISKMNIGEKTLYEFTSSGMTHVRKPEETNKARVGKLVGELNFGVIVLDWAKTPLEGKLQIRGKDNTNLHEELIKF